MATVFFHVVEVGQLRVHDPLVFFELNASKHFQTQMLQHDVPKLRLKAL